MRHLSFIIPNKDEVTGGIPPTYAVINKMNILYLPQQRIRNLLWHPPASKHPCFYTPVSLYTLPFILASMEIEPTKSIMR